MLVVGAAMASMLLVTDESRPVANERRRTAQSATPLESVAGRAGNELTLLDDGTSGTPGSIRFADSAVQSGVEFTYYGAPTREHNMTEQNGGGIAIFDFDADGLCDLFFSNGSDFRRRAETVGAFSELFQAVDFESYVPVGRLSEVAVPGFGQGCASGDFDNDGFADLALACFGRNRLWRNNGDGTFSEINDSRDLASDQWSTSMAFADLNADGLLDLYIVNYVDWNSDVAPCFLDQAKTRRKVCSPLDFSGQADMLLKNSGNGAFEPAVKPGGESITSIAKGLAVQIVDLNGDGRLDVFVANDTTRNFLLLNQGRLSFEETSVAMGLAMSQDGSLGSSMGVACGDYDRDGRSDLFVTNFANEVVDALQNLGDSGFVASNAELGIDRVSRKALNFGIVLDDFDLDGWPDLFFANGHIWDSGPDGDEYEMRPTVMANVGGKRFVDGSNSAGEYFRKRWLGRAVAKGDLDNDGDVDLLVAHLKAPAAILRNDSVRQGSSLRLQFIGTVASRDALGSQVDVELLDGTHYVTHVPSGGSFQASHSPVVVVPAGERPELGAVTIQWSTGTIETWSEPQSNQPNRSGTVVLV